jgi:hydroxymethylglutaryl-CoA reductase (NADPH)
MFGLSVPDEEVVKVQTVGEVIDLVKSQGGVSSSEPPQDPLDFSEDDSIPDRLDFTRRGQENRLQWLRQKTGATLEHLPQSTLDPHVLKGNIEHFIGMAQVPVGIAGPLRMEGELAQGTFYVPLATTEGALVASVTRGMMAITRSGGAHAKVLEDQVMRAPVFLFDRGKQAEAFTDWLKANFDRIKEVAESTTRSGKLKRLEYFPLGRRVSVRFIYTSGDASGQNMVTLATQAACQWIKKEQPVSGWQTYFLDANLAGDKKVSMVNFLSARGKKVYAEAVIKKGVLKHFLHTTPDQLVSFHKEGGLGSLQAGIWGLNAHYANMLAAIFIATGQDVACVHEAATGITVVELTAEGDLYLSVTLPNLIIASVGGGTGKGTQREALELLGCVGTGKVGKLAEIIAGTVLAGELSIAGAHAAGDFAQAHDRFGRNRPT